MSNLPELEVIDQIIEGAVHEQATKAPGLRQVHAKSHGCVWGEFTTHIPHPQLSQSVFTDFYNDKKLYTILKLLILTDKACFKGVIYSL